MPQLGVVEAWLSILIIAVIYRQARAALAGLRPSACLQLSVGLATKVLETGRCVTSLLNWIKTSELPASRQPSLCCRLHLPVPAGKPQPQQRLRLSCVSTAAVQLLTEWPWASISSWSPFSALILAENKSLPRHGAARSALCSAAAPAPLQAPCGGDGSHHASPAPPRGVPGPALAGQAALRTAWCCSGG